MKKMTQCNPKEWFRLEPAVQAYKQQGQFAAYVEVADQLYQWCRNQTDFGPCRACCDMGNSAIAFAAAECGQMTQDEVLERARAFDPTQMVRDMSASKGMTPQEWAEAYNRLEPPKMPNREGIMRLALEGIVKQAEDAVPWHREDYLFMSDYRRGIAQGLNLARLVAKQALAACK